MTSRLPSWKYDVKSKIRLCQSMHIYLKNTPAKFHPDLIRNDGALGFFEVGRPNKNNKMSSDVRSVPDLKYWPKPDKKLTSADTQTQDRQTRCEQQSKITDRRQLFGVRSFSWSSNLLVCHWHRLLFSTVNYTQSHVIGLLPLYNTQCPVKYHQISGCFHIRYLSFLQKLCYFYKTLEDVHVLFHSLHAVRDNVISGWTSLQYAHYNFLTYCNVM